MNVPSRNTILVHGYGFDYRTWYPLELAFESHNVIYLSLPGFGMDPVTEDYTIAELAKKFWKYLDEIGIGRVNLVGHSMGGYVCLEMLSLQPSRLSSLVLVNSHVYADSPEKKEARTLTMNDIKSNGIVGFINKFYRGLFADIDKSEALIKMLIRRGLMYDADAWYYGTLAMRDRKDHSETLRAAEMPVLLLMGGADKAVPSDLALKQSILAERTSMHLYESIGHMNMYENTRQVISDLVEFFDEFAS
ncbi:MAG: alpha/beta fold hydrolase [Saprospiraceae bacterium]